MFSRAHAQRNLLVLHALGHAGDDEGFLGRELNLRPRASRTSGLVAERFQNPMRAFLVEPGLSSSNFAQAVNQEFRLYFPRYDTVRASAKQFEREFFGGFLQNDDQLAGCSLLKQFANRINRV